MVDVGTVRERDLRRLALTGHLGLQVQRLVEEAIGTVYLNKARRPIAAVTRRVLDDFQHMKLTFVLGSPAAVCELRS
jgi:hypothetical protein